MMEMSFENESAFIDCIWVDKGGVVVSAWWSGNRTSADGKMVLMK